MDDHKTHLLSTEEWDVPLPPDKHGGEVPVDPDFDPIDVYGNRKKYSVYPEDFAKKYAAKSNVTMDLLIEVGFLVVACDCEEDGCQGWQMQTEDWLKTRKELGLWDDATKVYKVKDIYLGESPEEYYALHYPDMDKETLAMCLAGDASTTVCMLSCDCGRRHEIEYTPPPHEWYTIGITCACGRKVTYGE